MKRKYLVIALSILALVVLAVFAVPAFAAEGTAPAQPASVSQPQKAKILARLLLVQDEVRVDAISLEYIKCGIATSTCGGFAMVIQVIAS